MSYIKVNTDSYSVAMPSGWEIKTPSSTRTVLMGPKVGPFNTGMVLDDLSDHPNGLQALMDQEKARQSALSMYSVLATENLSTEAFTAISSEYQWYDSNKDLMLRSRQIFVRMGDKIMALSTVIPHSSYFKLIDNIFVHMLNSFRFNHLQS